MLQQNTEEAKRVLNRQQIHKELIFMSLVCMVIFSGCTGKRVDTVGFKKVDAPAWVTKGSGASKDGDKKIFLGVGSASGIKNYTLLRTTSENRARNEVAKVFEVYVASLMKDYMASTTAGDFSRSSEEQHVEQAIKTIVSTTLSGVEITDHWEYESKGILFSLARLDLNEFEQNLDRMKELNSRVRDYVRENAGKLHEELAEEEENRKEE